MVLGHVMAVTTYVFIHGAGWDSWYRHRVAQRLQALGHGVIAVHLPCDDDTAGPEEYAQAVVETAGDRRDLILVAQSLRVHGPLVCDVCR